MEITDLKIRTDHRTDVVLDYLKHQIHDGVLKLGDKLPSEKVLQERFNVSRNIVRSAIKKLEFLGMIKTLPQSGSYIESATPHASFGRAIESIIRFEREDFDALCDTRRVLEAHAAELAARNASDEDLAELGRIVDSVRQQVNNGERGLEEHTLFHLKIAGLSKNSILSAIIGLLTPLVDAIAANVDVGEEINRRFLVEIEDIRARIASRDPKGASERMCHHISMTQAAQKPLIQSTEGGTRGGTKKL